MSSPSMKSPLSNKTPEQLKVTELKEELKRRGVNTKGLKKDLVERLEAVLRGEQEQAARAHEAALKQAEAQQVPDPVPEPEPVAEAALTEFENPPVVTETEVVVEITKTEKVETVVTETVTEESKLVEDVQVIASVVEETTTVTNVTEVVETLPEEMKSDLSVLTVETVEQIKETQVVQETILGAPEPMEPVQPVEPMVPIDATAAKLEDGTANDMEMKEEEFKEELKEEFKEELKGEIKAELGEELKGEQVVEETVVETTVTEELVPEAVAKVDVQDMEADKESIPSGDAQANGSQVEEKMESPVDAAEEVVKLMDVDTAAQTGQKRKEPAETLQVDQNKRQRRWNSGKNMGAEAEARPKVTDLTVNVGSNVAGSDSFGSRPLADRAALSRPVVSPGSDTPNNGRIVSPSSKNPTTSLRIDRFVRPFTLKALKDLLAETGTVSDFWMDQIKTHCYITYSSVEEAVATRAALHNLKWPVVGGKQLIAEFVEAEEVKQKCESGNDKPATTTPRTFQSATPFAHRERPAPPPKREAEPIVTLDDLFKKTNTRPQIYYLPLTDAQVAAKLDVKS